MSQDETRCTLCGLDVGVRPFTLKVGDQAYRFCCEGCRGIYEMLHDIQAPPGGADEISANPGKDKK